MTSRQHQDWLNHGKPDSGLALPLQLLANLLAAAGYTVYVYPNDAHLDAEPPEDHTYYSETGWPGTSPKWWRHAIDIMPPPAGKNLPSLTQLGQTIFNARQAGQITWLKYMNWPADGSLSHAVHDKWQPGHVRTSSSDAGHIHLSSTTGCETLDSTFNPLTSIIVVGTTPTPIPASQEDDTMWLYAVGPDNRRWLCNGAQSFPYEIAREADLRTLRDEGLVNIAKDRQGRSTLDFPRTGWTPSFGAPVLPAPAPVAIDPATLQAAVEAALKAVGVSVSPAQVAAALEDPAVRAVLVSAAEAGANKAEDE